MQSVIDNTFDESFNPSSMVKLAEAYKTIAKIAENPVYLDQASALVMLERIEEFADDVGSDSCYIAAVTDLDYSSELRNGHADASMYYSADVHESVDTDAPLLGGFILTALNVFDKLISRTRLWIDVIDSGASCSMVQNDERLLGRISKLLGFKAGIQIETGQCDSTSAGILVVHTPRNAHNIADGV